MDGEHYVDVFEDVAVIDVHVPGADLILAHVARDAAVRRVPPHRVAALAVLIEGRLVAGGDAGRGDERKARFTQRLGERSEGYRFELLDGHVAVIGGDGAGQ